MIAFGALDDPAFVQAIRKAAGTPLWEMVSPTALEALFLPTLKVERLGGSLDDLLSMLLQSIAILQHPSSLNYAREKTALDHVNDSLDFHLEDLAHRERERGRRNISSIEGARKQRTESATAQAQRWLAEVQGRKEGQSEAQVHLHIANREQKTMSSVKKAIARHNAKKRHELATPPED